MSESSDGSREQFIQQPDRTFVGRGRLAAAPLQFGNGSVQKFVPLLVKTARRAATFRNQAMLDRLLESVNNARATDWIRRGNMAKTAVGLFANPASVDEVLRDLETSGILSKDVRVLGEPREMAGSGVMSIPHTDFEVGLIRDLTAFGVVEADAEAYVRGVRRGEVMVFATGSGKKADAAAEIMNRHHAVEIGELSGDDMAPARDSSVLAGRVRSSGGGACLFVW
jgi:hypothetical protein